MHQGQVEGQQQLLGLLQTQAEQETQILDDLEAWCEPSALVLGGEGRPSIMHRHVPGDSGGMLVVRVWLRDVALGFPPAQAGRGGPARTIAAVSGACSWVPKFGQFGSSQNHHREGLPTTMAGCIHCHQPGSLEAAITLVEDFLAAHPDKLVFSLQTTGGWLVPVPRRRRSVPQGPEGCSSADLGSNGYHLHGAGLLEVWVTGTLSPVVSTHRGGAGDPGRQAASLPAPCPGPGGKCNVPVRCQRGVHQAVVDSEPLTLKELYYIWALSLF